MSAPCRVLLVWLGWEGVPHALGWSPVAASLTHGGVGCLEHNLGRVLGDQIEVALG